MDLSRLALADGLNFAEFTLATTRIDVVGETKGGSIHIADGRISFAEIHGRDDSMSELGRHGIEIAHWRRALQGEPGATGIEILVAEQVSASAVRSYLHQKITSVVAELMSVESPTISQSEERLNPLGSEILFPISAILQEARLLSAGGELIGVESPDALVATCPTDSQSVLLAKAQWNIIASMIEPFHLARLAERIGAEAATEFVRFLQSRGLATVVSPTRRR